MGRMNDSAGPAETGGSPMGRYAPAATEEDLVAVELRRLPVLLLLAAREHHDGLMREFRLLALHGSIGPTDAPARFAQLVGILGTQYASARARRDEEIEAAIRRGETAIDQVAPVPPTAAASLSALQDLMDEADEFCRASLLVTVPRSPLLSEFSHWYLGQFADQLAGHPPVPWAGPLHP